MSLKDYFDKPTKIISTSSLSSIGAEVESDKYLESYTEVRERYIPNVDFGQPENFCFYGSAEKYYKGAFERIAKEYPYDGSKHEKNEWLNESTYLDIYIFQHRYPRFNGYINLGTSGFDGAKTSGYNVPSAENREYIYAFGGPHAAQKRITGSIPNSSIDDKFKYANKYDSTPQTGSDDGKIYQREGNLKFDPSDKGSTVEFWLKKPGYSATYADKEVIFDIWNGESAGTSYGRFRLELDRTAGASPFLLTVASGSTSVVSQVIGANITNASIQDWTHVALSLKNSGSNLNYSFYINGALNQSGSFAGKDLEEIQGALRLYIGALSTDVIDGGVTGLATGDGRFSGSLDEFRYWKTERNEQDIDRNYWDQVGGGTNTDTANVDLGIYYKFNEGITGTSSYDSVVLDYSGRISNGTWNKYPGSAARSTDSAMVLSGKTTSEFKDPTIYTTHTDYITAYDELVGRGKAYDVGNPSSLYASMPAWITEEDQSISGELLNLTQIMASYLDTLHLQIQSINDIKNIYANFTTVNYEDEDGELSGALVNSNTGSAKPLPFADRLLSGVGFVSPEIFANVEVIEKFMNKNDERKYDKFLKDIKNQIYQNVYANIANIFKKKGTLKSFRNILHCFGIDEEVVKVNFYADNTEYLIKDKRRYLTDKTKYVDFNNPERFGAVIYQYDTGAPSGKSFGYISGSQTAYENYIPQTIEAEVVFPEKIQYNTNYGFATPFVTASVFGMVDVGASSNHGTDTTTGSADKCNFNVYVERDGFESKRARFRLSSSALNINLSSSFYDDVYKNQKWNFAIKLKHDTNPSINFISGSTATANNDYTLEFYGVHAVQDYVISEFTKTATITEAKAQDFLQKNKRLFAGAERLNVTGSRTEDIVTYSDVKIGNIRYWLSYLPQDVIRYHAYDINNFGIDDIYESAYLNETAPTQRIPRMDTLILNWNFDTLSTSDNTGKFNILDASSGSRPLSTSRYDAKFSDYRDRFYTGQAELFPTSSNKAIDVLYHPVARNSYPDTVDSHDLVEIRTQDDIVFTKETRPIDYYIAFEKSPARVISEEMIKFMSSISDFSNLIGRSVDRYRQEYKTLQKVRQLFFETVQNDEMDFDKFWDYYKWFDDALGAMLVDLVPASIKHSDGISNVIESHIFERNKYWNKFPTLENIQPDLEGGMHTINHLLYNWKCAHAPTVNPLTLLYEQRGTNCDWWYLRAESWLEPLSGAVYAGNNAAVSGNLNTRKKIWEAKTSVLTRSYSTLQHLDLSSSRDIRLGINYEKTKNRDYLWGATKHFGETPLTYNKFGGFPLRYMIVTEDMIEPSHSCDFIPCPTPRNIKEKRHFAAVDGFKGFHSYFTQSTEYNFAKSRGHLIMPFNIVTSSVKTGYTALISGTSTNDGLQGGLDLVNLHEDSYGLDGGMGMQGPFSERWVGGHQSRHSEINRYRTDRITPTKATASIKVTGDLVDGKYFTLFDARGNFRTFKVDSSTTNCGTAHADGHSAQIGISGVGSGNFAQFAIKIKDAIQNAFGPSPCNFSAVIDGSDNTKVNIEQDILGYAGNTQITSIFITNVTIVDFSGGAGVDHATQNQYLDSEFDRGEGYRVLYNHILNGTGALAVVGPDYVDESLAATVDGYSVKYRPRKRYFRSEKAKRPLNFKNILMTTASTFQALSGVVGHGTTFGSIGNYIENYQVVHSFSRRHNPKGFESNAYDGPNILIPRYQNLPQTTQEATIIGLTTSTNGNTYSNFHNSNLYLGQKTSQRHHPGAAEFKHRSIMASKFSAPGGYEVMSEVFMDLRGKEMSVYNALPFRNLSVLGIPRVKPTSFTGSPRVAVKLADKTSNAYFLRSNTVNVMNSEDWSISLWVKIGYNTASDNDARNIFAETSAQGSQVGRQLHRKVVSPSDKRWQFTAHYVQSATNCRAEWYIDEDDIGTGWNHIVIHHSNSATGANGVKFYVNGVAVTVTEDNSFGDQATGFGAGNGRNPPNAFYLFAANATDTNEAKQIELDEISIWNVVIAPTNAVKPADLYNDGYELDLSQHSNVANIASWWRMGDSNGGVAGNKLTNDLSSTVIKDEQPSNNHLVCSNPSIQQLEFVAGVPGKVISSEYCMIGGSGEANTLRVDDIHGNRVGLRAHLSRHSKQFGIDACADPTASSADIYTWATASYHKTNRNSIYSVQKSSSTDGYILYEKDNYWVSHEIPRTDFQYAWVKASHTASMATSSMNRHHLHYLTVPSGTSTMLPYNDVWQNYSVPSQSLHERRFRGEDGNFQSDLTPIDQGWSNNYPDSGTFGVHNVTTEQKTFIGMTSYGWPTWEEIRNVDTPENVKLKKQFGFQYTDFDLSTTGTQAVAFISIPSIEWWIYAAHNYRGTANVYRATNEDLPHPKFFGHYNSIDNQTTQYIGAEIKLKITDFQGNYITIIPERIGHYAPAHSSISSAGASAGFWGYPHFFKSAENAGFDGTGFNGDIYAQAFAEWVSGTLVVPPYGTAPATNRIGSNHNSKYAIQNLFTADEHAVSVCITNGFNNSMVNESILVDRIVNIINNVSNQRNKHFLHYSGSEHQQLINGVNEYLHHSDQQWSNYEGFKNIRAEKVGNNLIKLTQLTTGIVGANHAVGNNVNLGGNGNIEASYKGVNNTSTTLTYPALPDQPDAPSLGGHISPGHHYIEIENFNKGTNAITQTFSLDEPHIGYKKIKTRKVDESRVVFSLPNDTTLLYNDPDDVRRFLTYKYPYYNIKFHFNNKHFYIDFPEFNQTLNNNESYYQNLYDYYCTENHDTEEFVDPNTGDTIKRITFAQMHVNQIIWPKPHKQTKYSIRSRRYFITDFWADNKDIIVSGTDGDNAITQLESYKLNYNGLNQIGRLKTNVQTPLYINRRQLTAFDSVVPYPLHEIFYAGIPNPFSPSINDQGRGRGRHRTALSPPHQAHDALSFISTSVLTQSMWPMDARVNYQSSSPYVDNATPSTALITISDHANFAAGSSTLELTSAVNYKRYTTDGRHPNAVINRVLLGFVFDNSFAYNASATVREGKAANAIGIGSVSNKQQLAEAIANHLSWTGSVGYRHVKATAHAASSDWTVRLTSSLAHSASAHVLAIKNVSGGYVLSNFGASGVGSRPKHTSTGQGVLQMNENYFHNTGAVDATEMTTGGHAFITPHPRYSYPHTIVSPGSVRCPTGRSSLGLISGTAHTSPYPLRSNHYWLTRSLGDIKDGLYDSMAFWDTPKLSGLEPFEKSYDDWYKAELKWHSKDFSLIPEYRISGHTHKFLNRQQIALPYDPLRQIGPTGVPISVDDSRWWYKFFYSTVIKANEDAYGTTTNQEIPSGVAQLGISNWLDITGSSIEEGTDEMSNLLSIAGNEGEEDGFIDNFATSTRIRDLDRFISDNKYKSSKLKISLRCDALYKFLPYYGFFPQLRTIQMTEAFAQNFLQNADLVHEEADPNSDVIFPVDSEGSTYLNTTIRPLVDAIMAPGLLYNTIKSGVAVDYPIITSKLETGSYVDPYGGTNFMINNEYFDDRLPFETLIEPYRYIEEKILPNGIVDANPHPSASINLRLNYDTSRWNSSDFLVGRDCGTNGEVYQAMANNFFAEVPNFFLEDCMTSILTSNPGPFRIEVQDYIDPSGNPIDPEDPNSIMVDQGAIYKMFIQMNKSTQTHAWLNNSQYLNALTDPLGPDRNEFAFNSIRNVPTASTNYFEAEYLHKTGAALRFDPDDFDYERPQANHYSEVETITMYSQPLAFGPPCAGGVSSQHESNSCGDIGGGTSHVNGVGKYNNTTYRMYDATNGFNAPFTPPYYDGAAWAVVTFNPMDLSARQLESGVRVNNTIITDRESGQVTEVIPDAAEILKTFELDAADLIKFLHIEYIRYELNHESGSYGDIGTRGPQGFTINENAMQLDASVDLKVGPTQDQNGLGRGIIIQSKFETPILDFSKYLLRDWNYKNEPDVNAQFGTAHELPFKHMTVSGSFTIDNHLTDAARTWQNIPGDASTAQDAGWDQNSLKTINTIEGLLTPIGMWHQYGDVISDSDKGIYLSVEDWIKGKNYYREKGSLMTICNPKYALVEPDNSYQTTFIGAPEAGGVHDVGNPMTGMYDCVSNAGNGSIAPYFSRQKLMRALGDEFGPAGGQHSNASSDSVIGNRLQLVVHNPNPFHYYLPRVRANIGLGHRDISRHMDILDVQILPQDVTASFLEGHDGDIIFKQTSPGNQPGGMAGFADFHRYWVNKYYSDAASYGHKIAEMLGPGNPTYYQISNIDSYFPNTQYTTDLCIHSDGAVGAGNYYGVYHVWVNDKDASFRFNFDKFPQGPVTRDSDNPDISYIHNGSNGLNDPLTSYGTDHFGLLLRVGIGVKYHEQSYLTDHRQWAPLIHTPEPTQYVLNGQVITAPKRYYANRTRNNMNFNDTIFAGGIRYKLLKNAASYIRGDRGQLNNWHYMLPPLPVTSTSPKTADVSGSTTGYSLKDPSPNYVNKPQWFRGSLKYSAWSQNKLGTFSLGLTASKAMPTGGVELATLHPSSSLSSVSATNPWYNASFTHTYHGTVNNLSPDSEQYLAFGPYTFSPITIRWGKVMKSISDETKHRKDIRSLAKLLGFKTPGVSGRQTTTKMGRVKESGRISEAIIAIPFLNHKGLFQDDNFISPYLRLHKPQIDEYLMRQEIIPIRGPGSRLSAGKYLNWTERGIPPNVGAYTYDNIRSNISIPYSDGPVTFPTGPNSFKQVYTIKEPDQSVKDQIDKMQKYYIPPMFDFINYGDQEDCLYVPMYIFEFHMDLEAQDYADLWQGVIPKRLAAGGIMAGKTSFGAKDHDPRIITHDLDVSSLLPYDFTQQNTGDLSGLQNALSPGEVGDPDYRPNDQENDAYLMTDSDLKDLQWFVFKVKKKSNHDFKKQKILDALKNAGVDINNRKQTVDAINQIYGDLDPTDPVYGEDAATALTIARDWHRLNNPVFNWPYDYCSIVENAKISVSFEFDTDLADTDPNIPVEQTPTEDTEDEGPPDTEVSCVLPGTMIETEDGPVPIEYLQITDKVLSYNFEKEIFEFYKINKIMQPASKKKWIKITTEEGYTLRCSESHPLYTLDTQDRKLPAFNAKIGDFVYVHRDKKMIKDKIKSIEYINESITVYNIEVADVHSYISDGILSHNKTVDEGPRPDIDGGPVDIEWPEKQDPIPSDRDRADMDMDIERSSRSNNRRFTRSLTNNRNNRRSTTARSNRNITNPRNTDGEY